MGIVAAIVATTGLLALASAPAGAGNPGRDGHKSIYGGNPKVKDPQFCPVSEPLR